MIRLRNGLISWIIRQVWMEKENHDPQTEVEGIEPIPEQHEGCGGKNSGLPGEVYLVEISNSTLRFPYPIKETGRWCNVSAGSATAHIGWLQRNIYEIVPEQHSHYGCHRYSVNWKQHISTYLRIHSSISGCFQIMACTGISLSESC